LSFSALYGTLFSETREAGFSNAGLWLSIGFIIVYLNVNMLCMATKLYLYIGLLLVGMAGYVIVEIITRLEDNNEISSAYSKSEDSD
jgi:hypothetical protein